MDASLLSLACCVVDALLLQIYIGSSHCGGTNKI